MNYFADEMYELDQPADVEERQRLGWWPHAAALNCRRGIAVKRVDDFVVEDLLQGEPALSYEGTWLALPCVNGV